MTDDTQTPRRKGSATPWLLFLLTLAGLGAVLYFGWDLYAAQKKGAEAAQQQLNDAKVKLAELDATNHALDDRVKGLEAEKQNLSASMTDLAENLKEAEAELARLKATYDSLEDKLQSEIKKGEIRLSQS